MATNRERAEALARDWIGTPYHHQASTKGAGTDCLGLIRGIYRELFGVEPETPPPYSAAWTETGLREPLLEAADRHLHRLLDPSLAHPGDVLFFRMREGAVAKHCGLMIQGGRMIHAQSGVGVVEVTLGEAWARRLAAAYSFDPGPD